MLETLGDQGEPTSLAALVLASGLHENTVRGHLEGLEEDGLVTRRRAEPDGRGRPAWLYSVTVPEPASEYAGLASALAGTLARTSADPVSDALEAGAEWGGRIAASRPDPSDARGSAPVRRREVVAMMSDLGFGPETGRRAETVRLTRCPLLDVAKEHTEIVCNVHLGLVRGALAARDDEDTEVDLAPFAEPGACLLHLRSRR